MLALRGRGEGRSQEPWEGCGEGSPAKTRIVEPRNPEGKDGGGVEHNLVGLVGVVVVRIDVVGVVVVECVAKASSP